MELTRQPQIEIDIALKEALDKCNEAKKNGKPEVTIATQTFRRNTEVEYLYDKLSPLNKALFDGLNGNGRRTIIHADKTSNPDGTITYVMSLIIQLKAEGSHLGEMLGTLCKSTDPVLNGAFKVFQESK